MNTQAADQGRGSLFWRILGRSCRLLGLHGQSALDDSVHGALDGDADYPRVLIDPAVRVQYLVLALTNLLWVLPGPVLQTRTRRIGPRCRNLCGGWNVCSDSGCEHFEEAGDGEKNDDGADRPDRPG